MQWFSFSATAIAILFVQVRCSEGASCTDKLPSCSQYSSHCSSSYVKLNCAQTCSACKTDACATDNGGCKHLCRIENNATKCSCETGFRLGTDGKSCADIDECTEGPNPCFIGLESYCINTIGSYSCQPYKCKKPGTMNYYRSGDCCTARNSSCGTTESIRSKVPKPKVSETKPGWEGRVLGGARASTTAWPWMVQLTFRGGAHCGGSLISDRWVVSAAHCFSAHSYKEMLVYLGQIRSASLTSVDRSKRIQRRIKQLITHANYTTDYRNDVALIQLSSSVTYNEVISPICLPCGEQPDVGRKCWVTGFGVTDLNVGLTSERLMEVDVPIVDTGNCTKAYRNDITIFPNQMICAGYKAGKKDACMGQPLQAEFVLRDSCVIDGIDKQYNVMNYNVLITLNAEMACRIGGDVPGHPLQGASNYRKRDGRGHHQTTTISVTRSSFETFHFHDQHSLGDSGGPMACQRADSCDWYLAGVTSFGKGCGLSGYYGVYANVLNYESWIRQSIGADSSKLCSKIYNPCRGATNVDETCYDKLDKCDLFSAYMDSNCRLACCQQKHGELPNCFDNPQYHNACQAYLHQCGNSAYRPFMRNNCKKTCKFC